MTDEPTPSTKARPRTLIRDQVYARLAQEIVTGRLAPLEEIRDQDLQAEYGVSRTPIREALIRLTDVGLVEMSSNRFTRVAPIDLQAQADRAEAAGALIAYAAAKVFPTLTDAQLESLDARMQAILDSDLARGTTARAPRAASGRAPSSGRRRRTRRGLRALPHHDGGAAARGDHRRLAAPA